MSSSILLSTLRRSLAARRHPPHHGPPPPPPPPPRLPVDVAERALVISYSTDSILSTGPTETTYHKKKIRIKVIDANTDVSVMADAILKSADVIPAERKPLVVELLSKLRAGGAPTSASAAPAPTTVTSRPKPADVARNTERQAFEGAAAAAAARGSSKDAVGGSSTPVVAVGKPPLGAGGAAPAVAGGAGTGAPAAAAAAAPSELVDWDDPSARMADVDTYLERLYDEDLPTKTEAAKKIVALSQRAANLISLCENAVRLCGVLHTGCTLTFSLTPLHTHTHSPPSLF